MLTSCVMADLIAENLRSFVKTTLTQFLAKRENGSNPARDMDRLSSLGMKYPKLRDHPLHSSSLWLESKRIDDGAEGLWRIHDGLYDFSEFVNKHPGGKDWLLFTKGTDITEAFESHHLSDIPKSTLKNYFIRQSRLPRNSPFTFKENDFYKVLRSEIKKSLPTLPQHAANRTKFYTDALFFSYLCLSFLAVYFRSFSLGASAGIILGLTAIAAHNFFHQRDNFRMYYFDFTLMLSREWRISHVLSHHLYTNTVYDLEISALEPFLQYLPTPKHVFVRYVSWFYSPFIYAFMYFAYFARMLIQKFISKEPFSWEVLLPFTVPAGVYLLNVQPVAFCALMFLWTLTISSVYFGIVGVNAAHHHPDIFHDGDAVRPKGQMDWGIYQLDAVMDRKDITGSHFLVLTNFGDHALHHLFPTIDHGHLEYLYPVFLATCEKFGLTWKLSSQLELVKGQYRQLAKTLPNAIPPGYRI